MLPINEGFDLFALALVFDADKHTFSSPSCLNATNTFDLSLSLSAFSVLSCMFAPSISD